ncbi:STAS domain-containing protein [Domibacillus sp. DTU_2020_1001157_1_SI_ALB_TIR_016]|uniref:STAS domain-containing protein n=1 Tax=Domibacillus sp. DTU_2020_1001157_1_SI_ALB_TIR_016 TaxID=3077789 RepID=UPI0028E89CB4|nr:STAS domain-containing protein [Domibacillus sp. DTU_2020_1001157_1_SI_ALB_TIR_016]WNS80563.1 STAS domain-containing protein [Domibacillus sp. DTU_2020_1001157_1_SI_ALB_TIR_016]
MNDEIRILGKKLSEVKYEIAQEIHQSLSHITSIQEKANWEKERAIEHRAQFIQMFADTLIEQPDHEISLKRFGKWGAKTGEIACSLNAPMDDVLQTTTIYRTAIWDVLKQEMKQKQMSIETVFDSISLIDPLLDQAVYALSITYVKFHRKTLEQSAQALLELSVPVVPITKGVAVLPLIGSMNTERAALLMEEGLQKAAQLKLSHLLLDLSGVVTVDTMVADQIFKVIEALSLLGVRASLIGIRPEVAQTMVTLGIHVGELDVKANLETALKDLQQSAHLFSS